VTWSFHGDGPEENGMHFWIEAGTTQEAFERWNEVHPVSMKPRCALSAGSLRPGQFCWEITQGKLKWEEDQVNPAL
jgi:hypothetical protein